MKGRKPKPTALKLLQGNPGHRAKADLGRGEPNPEVMLDAPPPRLNATGQKYWFAEGTKLLKQRIVTTLDQDALGDLCYLMQRRESVCQAIARIEKKAKRSIKEELMLSTLTNSILKLNDRIQRARSEFGMTPASRTRVKVDDGQAELPLGGTENQSQLAHSIGLSRG